MKYYYAHFKKTREVVEVEFPDLPGCVTFGSNFDEAFINAKDVLARWLEHAESKFIKEPSSCQKLKGTIVPISIDNRKYNKYDAL